MQFGVFCLYLKSNFFGGTTYIPTAAILTTRIPTILCFAASYLYSMIKGLEIGNYSESMSIKGRIWLLTIANSQNSGHTRSRHLLS